MTDFSADVWPSYKMTGRWGEGRNHLTLVSRYALLFVGTNFSLKCIRTIVLQLIFISCKCKSIVTIFSVIGIGIIIYIDREQIRVNVFAFCQCRKHNVKIYLFKFCQILI